MPLHVENINQNNNEQPVQDAFINDFIEQYKVTPEEKEELYRIIKRLNIVSNGARTVLAESDLHLESNADAINNLLKAITSSFLFNAWNTKYFADREKTDVDIQKANKFFESNFFEKIEEINKILVVIRSNIKIETLGEAEEKVTKLDSEEISEGELKKYGLDFSSYPEHMDNADAWNQHFHDMFDKVVYNISLEEENTEKKRKLEAAFNAFLNLSDYYLIDFFRSNSDMKPRLKGLRSFMLPFARKESFDRLQTKHDVVRKFEQMLTNMLSETESKYWVTKLGSQGLTMLEADYIDEFGRVDAADGGIKSMTSDPIRMKIKEEGKKGEKKGDQDFTIGNTFDFLTHHSREVGEDLVYEHAKVLRLVMFMQPYLITNFQQDYLNGPWNHASKDSRDAFDSFTNLFVEYMSCLLNYKQASKDDENSNEAKIAKDKLDKFFEYSGDVLIKEILKLDPRNEKRKRLDYLKNYFRNFEKTYTAFVRGSSKRLGDKKSVYSKKEFLSYKQVGNEKKVVATLAREENLYSQGKDEELIFNEEDTINLTAENDPQNFKKRIIQYLAGRMGTSLAVGLHNFSPIYARGGTPPGGIAAYAEIMAAIDPYSRANYLCYKGLFPQILSLYFDVDWDVKNLGELNELDEATRELYKSMIEGNDSITDFLTKNSLGSWLENRLQQAVLDPAVGKIPGRFENAVNIIISQGFTKMVNESISGVVRKFKVKLGSLNSDYYNLETAYPDPYTFVIRASRLRQSSKSFATDFQTWQTGYESFKSFFDAADAVPGGILDFEAIAKKNPKEFRTELQTSLQDLIQKIFSPLKSSYPWFRWEHVAQYIIMYIDKIYKVYRVCDNSEKGLKLLTRGLRTVISENSANMGGIGVTTFKEFKNEDGQKMYRVNRGLVASLLQAENDDLYENKNILTKEEYEHLRTVEKAFKARKYTSHSILGVGRLLGVQLPNASKNEKDRQNLDMPDIRDYLLGLIPVTYFFPVLGWPNAINNPRLDYDAMKIARSESTNKGRRLLRTRLSALKQELFEKLNRDKAEIVKKQLQKALFGVPEEDKKLSTK